MMENLKSKIKNMKGITLIALVVTIIVLIILAGITANLLLGENGIINKTKLAKEENDKATAKETMNLKITNVQILKYAQEQRMPTLKELADNFCEDDDFQYVQETSEVASLTKITNNNPTSIFTKLKAYPYEFEINSSLQLASIDGVQVATSEVPEGYVSQSDYNALLARVVALENNSNSQSSGSTASNNYSTDEQVVGTWIDGKPIYQRTLEYTGSSNLEINASNGSTGKNVDGITSIYNSDIKSTMDTLISTKLQNNNGYNYAFAFDRNTGYIKCVDNPGVEYFGLRINKGTCFTIQYTKNNIETPKE